MVNAPLTLSRKPPDRMPQDAWTQLTAAAQVARDRRIESLFAAEPERLAKLTAEAPHLRLDLSKQPWSQADLAVALDLAAHGANVVVNYLRNQQAAEETVREIITRGGNAVAFCADVSNEAQSARLIEHASRQFGAIGILVCMIAGYFASRERVPLQLTPITPPTDSLPFAFDISMAVRRGDRERKTMLDDFIVRRRGEIDRLLDDYGVPRL
jgi:hypothetical protein